MEILRGVPLRMTVCVIFTFVAGARAEEKPLRICSDPNNLPFSNHKLEGFENKIATLIANDLGRKIEYEWRAQRRGFFREALKTGDCDIAMGAPEHFELCLTTKPYYRSSYAFVSRKDLGIQSFDDARLKEMKIGVQVAIEGVTPPAQALARRGLLQNLRGYRVMGDYDQPNPPARIIDAVSDGDVDLAIAWGPMAGYFGKQQKLKVVPLLEQRDENIPLSYAICIGVRRSEPELRDAINQILERKQGQIDRILDEYGVPRVPAEPTAKQADAR